MVCRRGRHGAFGFDSAEDRPGLDVYRPIFWNDQLDAAEHRDDSEHCLTVVEGGAPKVDVAAPEEDENPASTDLLT